MWHSSALTTLLLFMLQIIPYATFLRSMELYFSDDNIKEGQRIVLSVPFHSFSLSISLILTYIISMLQ